MYDNLVKRLRDSEHEIDCAFCDRDCCYPDGKVHGKCIIIEAADAIEALICSTENGLQCAARILAGSDWMPLPEPPKEET